MRIRRKGEKVIGSRVRSSRAARSTRSAGRASLCRGLKRDGGVVGIDVDTGGKSGCIQFNRRKGLDVVFAT